MDYRRLATPEGEKSVLMIGEDHEENSLEAMLELLEVFRPQAISVELALGQYEGEALLNEVARFRPEKPLERPLTPEDFLPLKRYHAECKEKKQEEEKAWGEESPGLRLPEQYGGCKESMNPMRIAVAYALFKGIPLYFTDGGLCESHRPVLPDPEGSYRIALPYSELLEKMEEAVRYLFGDEGLSKAYAIAGQRHPATAMDALTRLYHFSAALSLLRKSPQGMTLRNETTAHLLNSMGVERVTHVGGRTHFQKSEPDLRDFEPYTPLQYLVDAPHRFFVDLKSDRQAGLGRIIRRALLFQEEYPLCIDENAPFKLNLAPELMPSLTPIR